MDFCSHSAVDKCLPNNPSIEDFWNLETIGIIDSPYTSDDECVLRGFNHSLKFSEGRYQVTWPWKEKVPELSENIELAFGRPKLLVRKLKNKPDVLDRYVEVIQDQCKKVIIDKVTEKLESNTKS